MALNSNIIQLNTVASNDLISALAQNVKRRRLELNLTQVGFAARAGIKLETYRRFERTGNISLKNLAKIAITIRAEEQMQNLFSKKVYNTLDDVLNEKKPLKRGKKNE